MIRCGCCACAWRLPGKAARVRLDRVDRRWSHVRLELEDGYLDYDLDLYRDVAHPINEKVQQLLEVDGETADMLDYPLVVDHLLGVGLAAAQVYLVAVIAYQRAPKRSALEVGRRDPSGPTLVQLINHGANFWKHADGWHTEPRHDRQDLILAAFSGLGIADDDRPIFQLVRRLTNATKPDLMLLAPLLEEWRTALEETLF
jgi:hypothetical protein